MEPYELIDHSSDLSLRVHGKTKEEVFTHAAKGMFSLIGDVNEIKPILVMEVKVSGENLDNLLVNWLNELLYIQDAKHLVFTQFKIKSLSSTNLTAEILGDHAYKYQIHRSVKAATYNQLELKQEKDIWRAKIVFDV